MSFSRELAELYRRDLTRLMQELQAFPNDQDLWRSLPGTTNSAGNLALHLEGNLREYVGRQLGSLPYQRQRDREFSTREVSGSALVERIAEVRDMVYAVVAGLSEEALKSIYPEHVFNAPISTRQLLISLHGHLNYHLGQIDYLRRILTIGGAIQFAGL